MKRIIKTVISAVLAAAILSCVISAGAVRAPWPIGDANGDRDVTILDATRIQRYLAGFDEMTKLQRFVADVNGDDSLDILDATRIQRKIADLDNFYCAYYGNYYISDYRFYASYNSGMARVGTPVTFHADGFGAGWGEGSEDSFSGGLDISRADLPFTYEFFIDGELVRERSENNELVYTFTQPGRYDVRVMIYNAFDDCESAVLNDYEVVQPYPLDAPVIVSTLFKDDTHCVQGFGPLTVRAEGGAGDYTYMYRLQVDKLYDGCFDDGFFIEEPVDIYSKPILSTGYIKSDEFTVPEQVLYDDKEGRFTPVIIYVTARDCMGSVSETAVCCCRRDIMAG